MRVDGISLGPGPLGSPHTDQPTLAEVVAHPDSLPAFLLRPLVRIDGGLLRPEWAGLPLCIFAHEVGIDSIEWQVEADGGYTLVDYNGLALDDPKTTRAVLEAHLLEDYDSLEDFADEMEETFDEVDAPSPLAVGAGDDIRLAVGEARWLQHADGPEPPDEPGFAFALTDHPYLFGCYYLFVDVERRRIRQVFQCT